MRSISHFGVPSSSRLSHSSIASSTRHKEIKCKRRYMPSRGRSPSSDSVNGPPGEDDCRVRLMSRGPKVTSPSTSSGSVLTRLHSAPTKPGDSRYSVLTMHPRIRMTRTKTPPSDVSIQRVSGPGSTTGGAPTTAPSLTLRSGGREERKWRCHRVWVFVN